MTTKEKQVSISARSVKSPNCLRKTSKGEELNPNPQYQKHEILYDGLRAYCRKCEWSLDSADLQYLLEYDQSHVIKMAAVTSGRKKPNTSQKKVLNLVVMWGDICAYCGTTLTDSNRTLDHYIPRSKGGENALGNLRLCCFDCNKAKADLDGPTWEAAIIARLCPKCLKSVVYDREIDLCCTDKWNQPKLKL